MKFCEAFHFVEHGHAYCTCNCDGWQFGLYLQMPMCGPYRDCPARHDKFIALGCDPI